MEKMTVDKSTMETIKKIGGLIFKHGGDDADEMLGVMIFLTDVLNQEVKRKLELIKEGKQDGSNI